MKDVTIVYRVTDEAAFAKAGNLLKLTHSGMEAHTVAAYDAIERCQKLQAAMTEMQLLGFRLQQKQT